MANFLTVSISANYQGNGLSTSNVLNGQTIGVTTNQAPEGVNGFSVPTVAAAIPLGGVSAPRCLFIQNLDPTNYITIYTDSTATVAIARLNGGNTPGGDPCFIPLDPSITAPYWKAHTAACS